MAGDARDRDFRDRLTRRARRLVDSTSVETGRAHGMPAMRVRVPDQHGLEGAWRETVLVEGPDGLPRKATLAYAPGNGLRTNSDGHVEYASYRREGADRDAVRWLDGGTAAEFMAGMGAEHDTRHALRCEEEALCAHMAARIEALLPECGFGPAFLDMLRCVRGWQPVDGQVAEVRDGQSWRPLYEGGLTSFHVLCADDAAGAALRAFCASNPLLAHVGIARVAGLARSGRDLLPSAAFPGITPAKAARLRAPAWTPCSPRGDVNRTIAADAVRLAGIVPVDWVPTEPAGVEAFMDVSWCVPRIPGIEPLRLVASSRGRWREFRERCNGTVRRAVWAPDSAGRSGYLTDPVRDLSARLLTPLMRHGGIHRMYLNDLVEAGLILYGGKSLPAVIETSRRWHAMFPAIRATLPNELAEKGWPALFEPVEIEGLRLVPLTTVQDLFEEGAPGPDGRGVDGLDHCVASYAPLAATGERHIVSVRRQRGDLYVRLATAEFEQRGDGTLRLLQVRARGNDRPSPEVHRTMDVFTRTARYPYAEPRNRSLDRVRERCGYDWGDPAALAAACAAYAPLLPRNLRSGSEAIIDMLRAKAAANVAAAA